MNLIWFLTIAAIISLTLGEFGQFPFGVTASSVSLTDFLLGAILIFLLVWQVGIKKNFHIPKIFLPLILFWGIGFIALIFNNNFSGILYLLRFILYGLSFLVGYYLIYDSKKNIQSVTKLFLSVSVLISAAGFLQLIFFPNFDPLTMFGFDPHQGRLASTFLDPNFTGLFLALLVPFAINIAVEQKSKGWFVVLGLILLSIVFTFSRTAYLVLVVELLIIGIAKYRKILLFLLLSFILLTLFIPRFNERITGGIRVDTSASERLESWQKGLVVFSENPIIGIGFNNFREISQERNLNEVFTPDGGNSGSGVDSGFLLVLATTGISGFLIYLSFWVLVFYTIIKKGLRKNLSFFSFVVGLLIGGQFINALFYPPIMLTSFFLIGGYLASIDP